MISENPPFRVWKMGARQAIVYVEGRERAERVVAAASDFHRGNSWLASEKVLPGAMAVYSDRRGRPFAWQIMFDIRRWEKILTAAALIEG